MMTSHGTPTCKFSETNPRVLPLTSFRDGPGYVSSEDERGRRTSALGLNNEIFTDDPWNAMCVLGLRVYSANAVAKISVIKGDESL